MGPVLSTINFFSFYCSSDRIYRWSNFQKWPCESLSLSVSVVATVQSLSHVWLLVTPWTASRWLSYPSLSPGVCSNSCLLSWWYHPTISSSVAHTIYRKPKGFLCCMRWWLPDCKHLCSKISLPIFFSPKGAVFDQKITSLIQRRWCCHGV